MVIKHSIFIVTLLYVLGFSMTSKADYRHFIWVVSNPVRMDDIVIKYNDTTVSASSKMDGGWSGNHRSRNVYSACRGTNDALDATQEKTAWLIMQNRVYVGTVPITLSIDSYNGWKAPGQAQVQGYVSRVNQKTVKTPLGTCWSLGSSQLVDFHWLTPIITIRMAAGSLAPGSYRVPVSYYYAFEENKFLKDTAKGPANNVPNLILGGAGTKSSFNLAITVESKCDFNSNPIQLVHDITLGDESSYKSNVASYSVSCSKTNPVKMELIGSSKPTGKDINFTKCGEGDCELTFNDGTAISQENITGKKDYLINSKYHPNDKSKTGSFKGAGILRVTIQ